MGRPRLDVQELTMTPPKPGSRNATHQRRIARELSRLTDSGYQDAFNRVREAQS